MVTLFFSYSHKDEALRDELEKHLASLKHQDIIDTWHDRRIGAGEEWAMQIDDWGMGSGLASCSKRQDLTARPHFLIEVDSQ